MYLAINIIGLIVFLAIGWLFSKDRKAINWRAVLTMTALNLVMAWFLTSFPIGLTIVKGAAAGFDALVQVSYQGIAFAIPSMVNVKSMDFFVSVLLPILMIVPLFDILTYIGVRPWIIKWIGRGLSFITRQPKVESFFAVTFQIGHLCKIAFAEPFIIAVNSCFRNLSGLCTTAG